MYLNGCYVVQQRLAQVTLAGSGWFWVAKAVLAGLRWLRGIPSLGKAVQILGIRTCTITTPKSPDSNTNTRGGSNGPFTDGNVHEFRNSSKLTKRSHMSAGDTRLIWDTELLIRKEPEGDSCWWACSSVTSQKVLQIKLPIFLLQIKTLGYSCLPQVLGPVRFSFLSISHKSKSLIWSLYIKRARVGYKWYIQNLKIYVYLSWWEGKIPRNRSYPLSISGIHICISLYFGVSSTFMVNRNTR